MSSFLQNLSAVSVAQPYHPILTCGLLSPWLQETTATSLHIRTQNCALTTATKKQLPPLLWEMLAPRCLKNYDNYSQVESVRHIQWISWQLKLSNWSNQKHKTVSLYTLRKSYLQYYHDKSMSFSCCFSLVNRKEYQSMYFFFFCDRFSPGKKCTWQSLQKYEGTWDNQQQQ